MTDLRVDGSQSSVVVKIRHYFRKGTTYRSENLLTTVSSTPIMDFSAVFHSEKGVPESTQYTECSGCYETLGFTIRQIVCYIFSKEDFASNYGDALEKCLFEIDRQNKAAVRIALLIIFGTSFDVENIWRAPVRYEQRYHGY